MCFFVMFVAFKMFSLGRVVLYSVFMAFPLPKALVINMVKNLTKNLEVVY